MTRIASSIILLLSLLCLDAQAQFVKAYGFKFGVSYADQHFENAGFYKSTTRIPGFQAALFIESFKTSFFSLVANIEFDQQGNSMDLDPIAEYNSVYSYTGLHNRIQYLSMPALAKLSLAQQKVAPYILIGPRLDYLIRYYSDYHYLDDNYSKLKKLNLGATAGSGCEFSSLLPISIIAELRYNLDLLSASNPGNKIRNDSFDLWFGCAI